jgi:hypothetical protein
MLMGKTRDWKTKTSLPRNCKNVVNVFSSSLFVFDCKAFALALVEANNNLKGEMRLETPKICKKCGMDDLHSTPYERCKAF